MRWLEFKKILIFESNFFESFEIKFRVNIKYNF